MVRCFCIGSGRDIQKYVSTRPAAWGLGGGARGAKVPPWTKSVQNGPQFRTYFAKKSPLCLKSMQKSPLSPKKHAQKSPLSPKKKTRKNFHYLLKSTLDSPLFPKSMLNIHFLPKKHPPKSRPGYGPIIHTTN